MLRSASSIEKHRISARDGEMGRVGDFLLDDRTWNVRYLVADTGPWLLGRKVLLAPAALREPDWARNVMPVELTRKQVEDAPRLDEEKPVSMQHEIELYQHYGWPPYWAAQTPVMPPEATAPTPAARAEHEEGDPHLRSVNEMSGYRIEAADGEIGHIDDFVLETDGWWVRYAVVKTRNWLPGRKVLIAPEWLESPKWKEQKVGCSLSREQIRNSPEYDPAAPVNREYEARLYDYYGRPAYWR